MAYQNEFKPERLNFMSLNIKSQGEERKEKKVFDYCNEDPNETP